MFSATLPRALDAVVSALFPRPPVRVRTKGSHQVVPTLRTVNHSVINGRRFEALMEVLEQDRGVGTMIFVNTRSQRCGSSWLAFPASMTVEAGQHVRRQERDLPSTRAGLPRGLCALL